MANARIRKYPNWAETIDPATVRIAIDPPADDPGRDPNETDDVRSVPIQALNGLLPVYADQVVAVSAANGSNSTGQRGRLDRPFQTLAVAMAAMHGGDTLQIYPGNYNLVTPIGVNAFAFPGVTLSRTDGGAIISDSGIGKAIVVKGSAALVGSGAVSQADLTQGVISTTNALSNVFVECQSINSDLTGDSPEGGSQTLGSCIYGAAGVLKVKVHDKINWNGGGGNQGWALWWTNGEMDVEANALIGASGYLIGAYVQNAPTGDMRVRIATMSGVGFSQIINKSTQAEAKLWINTNVLTGTSYGVVRSQGGKTYFVAQKIAGCTAVGDAANGVVQSDTSAGTLWLDAEKITYTYGFGVLQSIGTIRRLNVGQFEDLGSGTSGIKFTGGSGRVIGAHIAPSDGASNYPVQASANGLNLTGCTLIAPASCSFTINGSGNVALAGSIGNKTTNGITPVPAALPFNASVTN